MLGFCALAPIGDGIAKLLGETVPLLQLLLVRFAAQTVLLAPLSRGGPALTRRLARLVLIRTILHILGIGAMFLSLRFLPLADAVAIAFVMPFIMLLLGRFALGEEVGGRRLAACAVGFAGVLMVVQPSFAEVGAPALLPLFVALVFALFMLTTRRIAKEIDAIKLQYVGGLYAVAILAPIALAGALFDLGPALAFKTPTTEEALLLGAIGALGTFAHLLMSWSLRYAPAASLAPMQYLEIPFATLVGWAMFGDLPDGLAAVGIAVTVAAGLYVIARERAASRA
ncbi:MAG: DMT family transporter [Pseudomonadota bacterium]